MGENPVQKVVVVTFKDIEKLINVLQAIVFSLPTIESAYLTSTSKGLRGFEHADYASLRVAVEVLNGTGMFIVI